MKQCSKKHVRRDHHVKLFKRCAVQSASPVQSSPRFTLGRIAVVFPGNLKLV